MLRTEPERTKRRTKHRIVRRHDQIAIAVPEKPSAELQRLGEKELIDPHIHTLTLLRPKLRIAEIRKIQLVHRRRTEACRITGPQFRIGLLAIVASRQSIGRGIAEHIVAVVPNSRRPKETIPEIDLSLGKSCIRAQDPIGQTGIVFTLLLTKLIAPAEQEHLSDSKVMLPFDPIG